MEGNLRVRQHKNGFLKKILNAFNELENFTF